MLHPQARDLLRLIEEKGVPPMHTLSPADARSYYLERRFFTQPEPPHVAAMRELEAAGPAGPIRLRSYRPLGTPEDAVLPVLVYFHGGGWVIGDLETHDTLCRELCNLSGTAVIAVDYRLAPEHRFPAAVDDAIAATQWISDNAASLKVDANRLAVGGDSAGGNLAAVVALHARDSGRLPIAFQLLIYPATDQRRNAPSHTSNGQGYLLTKETITYFHDHYFGDDSHDEDWRASPLLAQSHADLPRAFILTAGYDPLRDEGLQYAQKLSEAGSRATLVNFERAVHGFILMGRVMDEANVAVHLCASQLVHALH
ncbi:alpha/beta hydrolase [Ramlibacter alkalitolerans]|uniref:Alpha/beta hydrolase n=1 Tax=Ramlibacter alkalitolerans TaxID=2039631 RepID=A0ABS1JWU0_9BURK|nr:alpha/beta hydrolase [Ramlibacter alkalitolerans]MBL0428785.1 alpha/beta hydrolase [Ramlibacter alkalitolerans]